MAFSSHLIYFFIFALNFKLYFAEETGLVDEIGNSIQHKISDFTVYVAEWLEDFNDRHLGDSEIGRMLHYNELKPKLGVAVNEGKNMKKLSLALIPVIFHVGATSTWMMLTSIMAAKSVAIGLALLVFKIAVSSAKVASFFTALKAKHHDGGWTPHYEHHSGYERNLKGSYYPAGWNSYGSELSHDHSSPSYKHHHEETPFEAEFNEVPKIHS